LGQAEAAHPIVAHGLGHSQALAGLGCHQLAHTVETLHQCSLANVIRVYVSVIGHLILLILDSSQKFTAFHLHIT